MTARKPKPRTWRKSAGEKMRAAAAELSASRPGGKRPSAYLKQRDGTWRAQIDEPEGPIIVPIDASHPLHAYRKAQSTAAHGQARRRGRLEHSEPGAAYRAAIQKFSSLGHGALLVKPFDTKAIERTAAAHGIKLPSKAASFVRYLRRNPIR